MKFVSNTRLFIPIILFALVLGSGCSTAESVYRLSADAVKSIMPGEEALLRKRVLVVPVINQAGVKEEAVTQITNTLQDLLMKDDLISATLLKDFKTFGLDTSSPQYEIVIDPELEKKAEEMGMDILIVTTLNPFEVSTKKSGVWPFRKMKKEVIISMSMSALDITNGTLVLVATETRTIKTDFEESVDQADTWEVDYQILDKEVSSILKTHSSAVSDELDDKPWTGKIILADNKTVMINGGQDIGVTQGSVFEVFSKSESIQSLSGKDYFFLGPKTGEIIAQEVMQKYTLAVSINDGTFEDGQLIRLKR